MPLCVFICVWGVWTKRAERKKRASVTPHGHIREILTRADGEGKKIEKWKRYENRRISKPWIHQSTRTSESCARAHGCVLCGTHWHTDTRERIALGSKHRGGGKGGWEGHWEPPSQVKPSQTSSMDQADLLHFFWEGFFFKKDLLSLRTKCSKGNLNSDAALVQLCFNDNRVELLNWILYMVISKHGLK